MTIFELADARRVAVRPSGTEPKIKFYLFGKNSERLFGFAEPGESGSRCRPGESLGMAAGRREEESER